MSSTSPPGGTLSYTLAYVNHGGPSTGVTLTDVLQAGLSYVPNSASCTASYDAAANTLTLSPGALTEEGSGQVTFQAAIAASAPVGSTISNQAEIACVEVPTPVQSNVVACTIAWPALSLSLSASSSTAPPGSPIKYTLAYANSGGLATGVTLTDVLPSGLSYVAGSASCNASYDAASHTLTLSLGTLAAGGKGQQTFEVAIGSTATVGSTLSTQVEIACVEAPTPVLSNAVACTVIAAQRGDWWMFHHDPQHTGRSPFTGPSAPSLKWKYATGDYIDSSPASARTGRSTSGRMIITSMRSTRRMAR